MHLDVGRDFQADHVRANNERMLLSWEKPGSEGSMLLVLMVASSVSWNCIATSLNPAACIIIWLKDAPEQCRS